MKFSTKTALLVASLALAACSQGGFGPGGSNSVDLNASGAGAFDPASPEYFNQTIGDRVLFAVDQSSLSSEAQGILAGQAQWLLSNPAYTAIIEGHADEQGTREYNLALGDRRAVAVRDYLLAKGLNAARVRTVSYGKERPAVSGSNEEAWAKNRRAATVLN